MRRISTLVLSLALLVGPSLSDLLARRGDACAVAPCCIGKTNKSCPMHSSQHGKGMRACGLDEQLAVAHQTVAILAPQIAEARSAAQQLPNTNPRTTSHSAPTPPDPPPPRAF